MRSTAYHYVNILASPVLTGVKRVQDNVLQATASHTIQLETDPNDAYPPPSISPSRKRNYAKHGATRNSTRHQRTVMRNEGNEKIGTGCGKFYTEKKREEEAQQKEHFKILLEPRGIRARKCRLQLEEAGASRQCNRGRKERRKHRVVQLIVRDRWRNNKYNFF